MNFLEHTCSIFCSPTFANDIFCLFFSYDHSRNNGGGSRSTEGGSSSHRRYKSRRRLKSSSSSSGGGNNGFDDIDRSPAHLEQLLDSDSGVGGESQETSNRNGEHTFGPSSSGSYDPSDGPFSEMEAGESYSASSSTGLEGPSAEEFDGGAEDGGGGGRSKF